MQSSHVTILILAVLMARISAQDVESNDVPTQCQSVCAPVVSLTARCDQQFNNDDAGQINCMCTGNNANTNIPLCEACYALYDPDGHDNDVHDIITRCSFTTTGYNPTSAAATGATTTSGTGVPASTSPVATTTEITGTSMPGTTDTAVAGTVTQGGTAATETPAQFTGAGMKGAELEKAVTFAAGLFGFLGALVV